MSTARKLHFSYEEYLRALEDSDLRLEYRAGVIYAMAGGTPEHGALCAQVLGLLSTKLPAGCRAFTSDVKVRISSEDVTVFPDAMVVCGKVERAKDDRLAVVNPGLVVEVTSVSTSEYDRGEKLAHYKLIPSLQAVWIVSHDRPRVTVLERHKRGWRQADVAAGGQLVLTAPALTLDVDAIYRALDGL